MKIVVIGTRGIPNILGGVETHCEELYPRLVKMGHDVTVIRRKSYVAEENRLNEYKGVKLIDIWTPRKKSLEAIIHTLLGVIRARMLNPDVVHFHAVGPSLLVPFARLLGMKVVMTNHGPDYDRQKWGKLAKWVIATGEKWGTRFSNKIIVISKVIAGILKNRYGREDSILIYNGVNAPSKSANVDYIESLGLAPQKYILAIGRLVKEKGFHDLIDAYAAMGQNEYKLAIAGDSDHPDEYSESLKSKACQAGAVLTGFIKGEKLNQIMTNAALFVIPSYHEGLPIAMLEAMSYNLDIVSSDIPANKIDSLEAGDFFKTGDVGQLKNKIKEKLSNLRLGRQYDLSPYNWDHIAEQVDQVYKMLSNSPEKDNN